MKILSDSKVCVFEQSELTAPIGSETIEEGARTTGAEAYEMAKAGGGF